MDAYKYIQRVETSEHPKNLKVRLYNFHNGAEVWLDVECLRLYDFDMTAYLQEEFGFPDVEITFEIIESAEEVINKLCFSNGIFSMSKYDEYINAVQEHGDDVVLAAYQLGISLDEIGDKYKGAYDSMAAYAESSYQECFGEIPENLKGCINWEAVADKLFEQETYFNNGHVFDAC